MYKQLLSVVVKDPIHTMEGTGRLLLVAVKKLAQCQPPRRKTHKRHTRRYDALLLLQYCGGDMREMFVTYQIDLTTEGWRFISFRKLQFPVSCLIMPVVLLHVLPI